MNKQNKKQKKISFTVSDELFDAIEDVAFANDENMSYVVRKIVVGYLRESGDFGTNAPALTSSARNSYVRRFIAEGPQ